MVQDKEQCGNLNELAKEILQTCILIKPEKLRDLLGSVKDSERGKICRMLEKNAAFSYVSLLGCILEDYGQWTNPIEIYERRRDNHHQAVLMQEYFGVMPVFGFGFPMCFREDALIYSYDSESDEDILDATKEELAVKGLRDMDIELYIAFCRLDFERVKELLNDGANPDIEVCEGHSARDLARLSVESAYGELSDLLNGHSEEVRSGDCVLLIELAAYDEMLKLFDRQRQDPMLHRRDTQCDRRERPDFTFDFPDCGWCDMRIYFDGNYMTTVNLSDVYDPFPEMMRWLEKITCTEETEGMSIDCEGYIVKLTYTPDITERSVGIFTFSDDSGEEDGFNLRTERSELVSVLYRRILEYGEELQKWDPEGDDFDGVRNLRSEIVEDYLNISSVCPVQ